MANDDGTFELSRRKALAGLGTIGIASAGAGLGTSAFFSDEENFEGNTLVAGTLDLKVDWQEHYSDWSDDEGTLGETVWMPGDSGIPTDAVPKPTPEEPMLFIRSDWVDDFETATAIDAFPDVDDDGVQDLDSLDGDGTWTVDGTTYDICEYSPTGNGIGADTTAVLSDQFRTDTSGGPGLGGADPAGNPQVTAPGDALVQISDVKPGDFGELTLSAHLCGNDGYLWLTGDLVRDIDNVNTEPEIKDLDEAEGLFGTNDIGPNTPGELAREIRVAAWYDDGDNIKQDDEVYIVPPTRLGTFLDAATNDPGIPLAPQGANGGAIEQVCTTDYILDIDPGRALEVGDSDSVMQPESGDDLTVSVESVNENAGFPRYQLQGNFDSLVFGDYEGMCVLEITNADGETREFDFGGLDNCVESTQVPQTDGFGEVVRARMRLCLLEAGENVCFTASEQEYFGFAWWLPVDHANEIQGDLIEFDLGFYAEQCRHNDGSGMPPENGG